MLMDKKTFIKLFGITGILFIIFIFCMLFFANWLGSYDLVFGFVVGTITFVVIYGLFIGYVYPWLFKDYIKKFWTEHYKKELESGEITLEEYNKKLGEIQ